MADISSYALKNLPLIIDSIRIPGVGGVIGLSSCPGLKDDYVFDLYNDSLAEDVQSIKAWGAAVVITLMDDIELQSLGVRDMGRHIASLNMVWLHLPLANMGLPDKRFDDKWQTVTPSICDLLRGGQKVLIHCREGVGRAALIASRLLVDLGLSPEETVSLVRKARPWSLPLLSHEHYIYSLSARCSVDDQLPSLDTNDNAVKS